MYYTHHFAHPETLARARAWLTQLGVKPEQIHVHAEGIPRLGVAVESHWLAEIRLLINAVERSDPDGFPSFWDEAKWPLGPPGAADEEAVPSPGHAARFAAIGWHPPDPSLAADPALKAISEAMSR